MHASQTIASYFLPQVLVQFHARFPGIELVVAVGNTAQVARAVVQGDAELGFIEGPVNDPLLAVERVGQDEMIIVVAPRHAWAGKASLSRDELLAENWVLREDGSGTRAIFAEALASLGVDPAKLRIAIALPSNEAVRAAVEAGAGATALSARVCAQSIAAGRLVRVETRLPKREFNAVQHVEHYRTRTVAALLGFMRGDKALSASPGGRGAAFRRRAAAPLKRRSAAVPSFGKHEISPPFPWPDRGKAA